MERGGEEKGDAGGALAVATKTALWYGVRSRTLLKKIYAPGIDNYMLVFLSFYGVK